VEVDRSVEKGLADIPLFFSDNSEQFDITETGLIRFTAAEKGSHEIIISVRDIFDNEKNETFLVEVR